MLRRWAAVLGTAAITLAGLSGPALATGSPDDSVPAPSVTAEATPGQQVPVEPALESVQEAPDASIEAAETPETAESSVVSRAMAAPLEIGNVVLQASREETGTGHGTDAQCFLSTRGGVPTGPLDDSPEDAYVCTRDSVDYKINFSVAASSEPTSVRIKLDEIVNAPLSRNTLTNFCTPSAGSFEAVRNDSAGKDCTFTFPAGSSQSGSWPIVYETQYGTESIWTPQYEATVNQAAAQVIPAEGFQVLMTPVGDLWFYSDTIQYIERDGKVYARYAYGPVLRHTSLPVTSPATSRTKGQRQDNWDRFQVTTTLDLGAAPLDNAIITGSNQTVVTVNPDKTVTFAASNVSLSGASGMSLGRAFAHVFVDIPVDDFTPGVTTSWQPHFYNTTMTVLGGVYANNQPCSTCSYTHPDLYGGLFDQPGEGQPVDFVTSGWMGVGYGGQTRPNNDWNLSSFDQLPAGDLFGKHIADGHLSEAAPGALMPMDTNGIRAARRPYDHKFWTKLYTVSAPINVDERLVFCDAYENLTWSADNGLAFYDPSRTPDIFRYSSVDGSKIPITDYQLWFKTVGTADNPSASQCGDAADLTGWTQDPTGADTIKVVIPGGFNLVGNGTTSVEAWLPFRSGPESAYPEWPGATIIRNVGTATVDPELGQTFPTGVPRHWYLGGRFSSASGAAGFFSPGGVWGTPRPTELSSGMYTSAGVENRAGLSNGVKSEESSDAIHVTGSIQLDSCMVDPTNVRAVNGSGIALGSPQVSNFEYTITSADPGPDGVACTADDVGGAIIDYSYDSEPSYVFVTFDFQVSELARPGTTLSFTRTGEATFEEPGAVARTYSNTATIRVVTPQVLGQTKTRTHVLEPVGTRVGWLLTVFNNTPNPVFDVEFIDVLPYNGDGRGTDLTAALEQVRLETADMGGAEVYVSTAAPDDIPRDVTDEAVDPSNTDMWCQYGTEGCAEGEGVTAVYLWFDRMEPNQYNTLGVSVGTDNQSHDDLLVNDMGTGDTPSVSLPVQPSRMVETRLYLPRNLSGTVYHDHDRDGGQDTGEPGIEGWSVDLSGPDGYAATTTTDAAGDFIFTELKPGTYLVTISDPETGQVLTQSYTVIDPDGVLTDPSQPATIAGADVTDVDFGIFVPATLSGHVYLDTDTDGDLTAVDTLQPDQQVTLHRPEGTSTVTTTDAEGFYVFTELTPGDYLVSWVAPDGTVVSQVWTVSNPAGIEPVDGRHTTEPASVPYGGAVSDVDFGYYPIPYVDISIVKLDASGGTLSGARFALYDVDPATDGATPVVADVALGADPWVFLASEVLKPEARYWLVETRAPQGHALLAEPVVFDLAADGITLVSGTSELVKVAAADQFRIEVGDVPAAVMPHTGGTGAGLPVAAAVLLVLAGTLALRRRLA